MCQSSCNSELGSDYYTEQLIEGINAKETITIEIGQTYKGNGGVIKDVDNDSGGGVTISKSEGMMVVSKGGDQRVIVSGNSNHNLKDTEGKSLSDTASDILLHELVGHAIPHIVGSDTGNAVENENKARTETKQFRGQKTPSPLRAAEPDHDE